MDFFCDSALSFSEIGYKYWESQRTIKSSANVSDISRSKSLHSNVISITTLDLN